MTYEERVALLKQVAEVAPIEMKAEYAHAGKYSEVECVRFMGCHESPLYFHLDSDYKDGEPIIAMLDAMESAGHAGELRPMEYAYGGGTYGTLPCVGPGYVYRHWLTDTDFEGDTRGEAVAKAFASVFKAE